jgi:hypothetical protein
VMFRGLTRSASSQNLLRIFSELQSKTAST